MHGPNGEIERVDLQPHLMAHDFPLLLSAAREGLGIALLPEMTCADAVRRGELELVVPEWHLPMGICHAVFPSRRGRSQSNTSTAFIDSRLAYICHAVFPSRRGLLPAVRVFIDYLAEHMPAVIEANRLKCSEVKVRVTA